jgi:predicted HTH domain antitoxin
MDTLITIDFPESLAQFLKLNQTEFAREIKILSIIKLYELGKISSGKAAQLLKISRTDFLLLLGKYNVSYFSRDLEDSIESDLLNA